MDKMEVIAKLRELELNYGRSPSVQELANVLGVSGATVWRYLKEAVNSGLIVERDGKYMSIHIAKAFKRED